MADIPVTDVTVSHRPESTAASDAARARELYKYFRPPAARATADTEGPDTVLTAHAQLVAWRFNAQRAMVSLIDRETQYFIAESTKTLHLDDALQHEDPDDAIWAGCINVPKAGRLCEHTIATLEPSDGGPACFEVLDLSQDDRFNTLGFIAGPPHFRYYIGVPIRTKKGINIGSIFALDHKVRGPASRSERHFLGCMAENVVQHLELMKDKRDRQRSTVMNSCLATFVDPDLQRRKRRRQSSAHSSRVGSEKHGGVKAEGLMSDSDSGFEKKLDGDERFQTFNFAASLMMEALDLEEGGGGLLFLDTTAAVGRSRARHKTTTNENVSSSQESEKEEQTSPTLSRRNATTQSERSPEIITTHSPRTAHSRPAEIIAHTSHAPQTLTATRDAFTPLSPADLSSLIKRHPRGRLFTFEDNGQLVSSSSDEHPAKPEQQSGHKHRKTTASKTEIALLRKAFPSARQLIFLPLWDSTTSRWAVCFAYNCSEYRNFSTNPDFLYCVAFCNCIMTEITQIATIITDQQKTDFIGSISHELRSPLHGILASCEFLGDTECTSFQRSLVDTADGCARTLLDTINMVLDYSKINTFERNTTKARRSRRDIIASGPSLGVSSHLNIYADVDLAAITEEVIEGVATGHAFRDSLAGVDVHDITDSDNTKRRTRSSLDISTHKPAVEIVVDISCRDDWTFWSQAGALRRIVMNLFGNSLKYTRRGFVHIKLESEDIEPRPGSNVCTYVKLTVTDTGQGISPEYMRTKLFTPFAQESSLTPGTGLGLSLVKSIVDMLQGEIAIESTVGVGTKVVVRLPMTKGTPTHSSNGSATTPSTSGSTFERVKDDSIDLVKVQARSKSVSIFPTQGKSSTSDQGEGNDLTCKSIQLYVREWFGFEFRSWDHSATPDIIFVEETDIYKLIGVAPQLLHASCPTKVLVVCNTSSTQASRKYVAHYPNFEEIRYPFGPYKLARALRICLETKPDDNTSSANGVTITLTKLEDPSQPPMEEVITAVENFTIAGTSAEDLDISVVKTGALAAREDSVNAQMAMNHIGTYQMSDSPLSEKHAEFPFEADNARADGTVSPTVKEELLSPHRPTMPPMRRTISITPQEMHLHDVVETHAISARALLTYDPTVASKPAPRSPRMLLVDDNRINLKLLQTFMRKRKYTAVTNAEDGLEAVNAYEQLLKRTPPEPPDIILMDISMPIMNGFEATRRIREIENEYREQLPPMQTPPSCLIIALTGLASGRDQSEAFTSGFDLYITKPVSFAEISRLLDNWEANGGAAMADAGVPHGAAVAGQEPGTPTRVVVSPT